MLIREIQPQDNEKIAAVIREVFIADNYPKTGTAFADVQLDFMFEAYDKPRATYFVVENEGKIIGGAGFHNWIILKKTFVNYRKCIFCKRREAKELVLR